MRLDRKKVFLKKNRDKLLSLKRKNGFFYERMLRDWTELGVLSYSGLAFNHSVFYFNLLLGITSDILFVGDNYYRGFSFFMKFFN